MEGPNIFSHDTSIMLGHHALADSQARDNRVTIALCSGCSNWLCREAGITSLGPAPYMNMAIHLSYLELKYAKVT